MSTRANIVVKSDGEIDAWFYRHSDGYPDGALPLLNKFMDWLKARKIRDNISQACGWLIVLGHHEYRSAANKPDGEDGKYWLPQFEPQGETYTSGWKVGAIEPTDGIHEDIEYLYTIDLTKKTLTYNKIGYDYGAPPDYSKPPRQFVEM
jgi:hypothetical protein